MFIIYLTDLSTKKNVKTGVHILTKIKNQDCWNRNFLEVRLTVKLKRK